MDATTEALLKTLEAQRAHVIGCLEGLDPAGLRTATLPTGWTALGMVQHLTLDVERFWFERVMAGDEREEHDADAVESSWDVDVDRSPEAVVGAYRSAIELSNAVIERTPLEAPPSYWPDFFGEWRLADLRAVMLHVIAETACHAGHLDASRELIDGGTWLILE